MIHAQSVHRGSSGKFCGKDTICMAERTEPDARCLRKVSVQVELMPVFGRRVLISGIKPTFLSHVSTKSYCSYVKNCSTTHDFLNITYFFLEHRLTNQTKASLNINYQPIASMNEKSYNADVSHRNIARPTCTGAGM